MYRIPPDLDISPIVGQFMTQVCVGQFDIQFTLGAVAFMIQSEIRLIRGGNVVGTWSEGRWPDPTFYDIMNTEVVKYEVLSDREIIIHFGNGVQVHLQDNSEQYECIHISRDDISAKWII